MGFKLRPDISSHTTLAYRNPPVSGNQINGLNETEFRPARHVFHNDGSRSLPWDQLDRAFAYINPWNVVLLIFKNMWHLRKSVGPAGSPPRNVENPAAEATRVKHRARELGADLVGITTLKPEYVFQGREAPYQFVISIGVAMDRDRMSGVPDRRSAGEVMRSYARIGRIVSQLSEEIRADGWPARAYGNPNSGDILHIPAAIDAGLGQLGKHGSLISQEHGSNFRLGSILTDLPMSIDTPLDIGVDDLCAVCQVCVRDCPVDAIFEQKQLVRGQQKWYVDFDRCIYYFCETYGCGICIEVCPWNEPGRGSWLSKRLLDRRSLRH